MGIGAVVKRFFGVPSHAFSAESGQQLNLLTQGIWGDRWLRYGADRNSALEIPAVKRGRDMIAGISTLGLEALDASNVRVPHPLLAQIDPNVANEVVLAQTLDDLLFEGVSWWRITGFGWDGYPVSAVRVDPAQVSVTAPRDYRQGYLPSGEPVAGEVRMHGDLVPHAAIVRFDSLNPPLIETARRAVRRAIMLDEAAATYAGEPKPLAYFSSADPLTDPLDDDAIRGILDDWQAAVRERTTPYIPVALKYNAVQMPTPADIQLVQLQERVSLDLAIAMGLDPEDVGISTTSRTYQNGVDRRKDRINDVLSSYMAAITGRLSMPDVTKRGVRVKWNLDDYLRADPLTRAQVNEIYLRNGVVSREWVAASESLPPSALPPAPVQPRPVIDAGRATVTPLEVDA